MARLVAWLRRLVASFASRVMRAPAAQRYVAPVFPRVHLALYRWTRGRVNLSSVLVPSLVLRTIGARTGLPRETPLMCFPRPDGSYLVAGSNWGQATHPAWTANLLAHPDATIVVGRRELPVRAQLLDGDDREAAWPVLEAQWPGYREYETTSGRRLRVFRLVPAA
jgi:deazaflavin-dependent oxidoreductase (nitroreductase family)